MKNKKPGTEVRGTLTNAAPKFETCTCADPVPIAKYNKCWRCKKLLKAKSKPAKCSCEMPAKIKGENKCWRCKNPIEL